MNAGESPTSGNVQLNLLKNPKKWKTVFSITDAETTAFRDESWSIPYFDDKK
jgi:hypothetical protein